MQIQTSPWLIGRNKQKEGEFNGFFQRCRFEAFSVREWILPNI